jgi:hypothetical protein
MMPSNILGLDFMRVFDKSLVLVIALLALAVLSPPAAGWSNCAAFEVSTGNSSWGASTAALNNLCDNNQGSELQKGSPPPGWYHVYPAATSSHLKIRTASGWFQNYTINGDFAHQCNAYNNWTGHTTDYFECDAVVTIGSFVNISGGNPAAWWGTSDIQFDGVPSTPVNVSASFNLGPYTAVAPASIDAYDTSTGSPTSWGWAVGPSVGVTLQNGSSQHATFLFQYPGDYTIELTAFRDSDGDYNITSQDITLGTWTNVTPAPSPTITVAPTVTGLATMTTFPTALPAIINRSAYLADIQEGLIGNITAPITDMTDSVGTEIENYILAIMAYLTWPFDFITDNLAAAIAIFDGLTAPFIHASHWVLFMMGQMVLALPPGGEELGSLILIGGIIYTVLRDRLGNG